MRTCNNCGTEYEGNFCPNCGQKPNSGRIVFKESARDMLVHFFDVDAPLFRTIKGMITNPGLLIREYIHGKRKSYSHPFRFFIFALAIYIIIRQLIDFNPIALFSEMMGATEAPNPNNLTSRGSLFFSRHINTFLLIYAFMLSAFSKLFFRKSRYYYVEYLALSFFVIAEYILGTIIITLLTLFSPYFFILNYLIVFFYPIYVLLSFHQEYSAWNFTKAFFTSLIAWLLYAFLGLVLAIFIVALFDL